jgi:phosphate transport system substrate-binding protein
MRWRAVFVAIACLAAVMLPASHASALTCADGPTSGGGVNEQRVLQNDLFIPTHETECPTASGTISYEDMTEPEAVLALQNRQKMFIALNQPMTTDEWAIAVAARNNPGIRPSAIFHLPMMIDGFVVTAKVSGCPVPDGVKLNPLSLSLIYSGAIGVWGDPVLVKDNPTLAGCNTRISVGVRNGDAWSTAVLKDYMSKRNPLFAAYKQRDLLSSWPGALDIDCLGFSDDGMATCASGAGAIAYLPYRTAKAYGLSVAQLINGKDQYIAPAVASTDGWPSNCPAAVPQTDLMSPGTVLSAQTTAPATMLADWSTFSMTFGTGYPMCGMSFIATYFGPGGANPEWTASQRENMKDHLQLMARADMQSELQARGYSPLPAGLATNVRNAIALIS